MGFIKKIIGNLLSFLGGLLGSFGKVLGFKKSGYFLELDESKDEPQSSTPANTVSAISSASNGASPKPEPAKLEPVKVQPAKSVTKADAQTSAVEQKAPDAPVPASKPAVPLNDPQPVPTFATDFLVATASQNGRRRPGPSMNYFLDMAKKVKA
jgi:type IV secretory pathway VirB10-like protein